MGLPGLTGVRAYLSSGHFKVARESNALLSAVDARDS